MANIILHLPLHIANLPQRTGNSKNGTKGQSYNDNTIVSTLENKRRTDSVDDRGIDDISAECPRRSRFSDTGRLDEEEAEDDIANCDEPFSPGESQTTTQKRTPPTKGLSDRWESPPSSASPLWSFGVKNHKNVNKQSGTYHGNESCAFCSAAKRNELTNISSFFFE